MAKNQDSLWVAVSYGALEVVHGAPASAGDRGLLVLPAQPAVPLSLGGHAASLFRLLVSKLLRESELDGQTAALLREFGAVGLASADASSSSRLSVLDTPWFVSPVHELVTSLAIKVATEIGARAVVIKGPVLAQQGLRSHAHSGDVDLWVEPTRIDDVARALEAWGWSRKRSAWDGTEVPHSVTLTPGAWGCEIDLHRDFPGVGLERSAAFRLVADNATVARIASHDLPVPDRATHAVIAALNLARPDRQSDDAAGQLVAAAAVLRAAGTDALARAEELKATGPLGPALHRAFPGKTFAVHPRPLNWTWLDERNATRGYLAVLRGMPLRRRVIVMLRLLWPTAEVVRHSDQLAGTRSRSVLEARWHRWVRGARDLITVVRERARRSTSS